MQHVLVAAVCLAILIAAAAHAVPTYSEIELQARSNLVDGYRLPPGSSFNSGTPALDDQGRLTFRLIVVGTTGNAGLWYGAGGSGTVVYHAPVGPLLSDPSVNAAGKACFEQADIGLSDGVFVYDPITGTTTQEVAPGGIFGIDSFGRPWINASDVIGFRADQGAQNAYIFDDDGTQTPVAFEGGAGVGFLFSPCFDDSNRFHAKVRLGGTAGSQPDEIRRYEVDGSFTVMAVDDDGDPLSPFTGFSNGVGCARAGDLVAFTAQRVGGGEGVYLSDGVTVTEIASTDHPDVSGIDFFAPRVNDAGVTAFRAFDAAGLRVIYAGDGTTLRRVIGEHDTVTVDLGVARIDQHDSSPVFGGTVAINTSGDIAFAATLTPAGDNQVEWGTGMFIAHASGGTASPLLSQTPQPRLEIRPNPFRRSAEVRFSVLRPGAVRLVLFDVSGRRLMTLWDGDSDPGVYSVPVPRDRLAPGVYFLSLTSPHGTRVQRLVRIR